MKTNEMSVTGIARALPIMLMALILLFSVTGAWAETVAPEAQTTTTTTDFFAKERWGISYFNYMNGPTFQESKGGSINHYFTLKHKVNPDWSIAGVFRPDSNFATGESFFTLGDSYLQIGHPVTSFDGGKVYGKILYFLPMSESSRKAELAGILSTRIYAELETGPWHFTYVFIPKLYLNTKSEDGQKLFSQAHWIQATYDVTSSFAFDLAFYPAWTYSRNKGAAFNDLLAYPGFTAKFSKDLSLSPYIEVPLLNTAGKSTSVGASLSYTLL